MTAEEWLDYSDALASRRETIEPDRLRRLAMHVGWLEGAIEMAVRELRAGRDPLVLAEALEGMLKDGKEKYDVR